MEVNPDSGSLDVERSKLGIANNERKWKIRGSVNGVFKVEAVATNQKWDWFEVEVVPQSYKLLAEEQRQFISDLASEGRAKAREFGLPLSAMIACGCAESGFGMSDIYKRTLCPFNLQKPAEWEYPKCATESNDKAKTAPFCVANDLSDAARLWCEWIKYHPSESARSQLAAHNDSPKEFAEKLYLMNFANSDPERTREFGKVWEQHELGRFD